MSSPISVFIADDPTGIALSLAISVAHYVKLVDDPLLALVIIAEPSSFAELSAKYGADILTVEWLEKLEATRPVVALPDHYADPALFLRGERVRICSGGDLNGNVWNKIYTYVIEHLGGRVLDDSHTERITLVCVVQQPSMQMSCAKLGHWFGKFPVVSSEWVDACMKAREKLPLDSFLVSKENYVGEANGIVVDGEASFAAKRPSSLLNTSSIKNTTMTQNTTSLNHEVVISSQYWGQELVSLQHVCARWSRGVDGPVRSKVIVCRDSLSTEYRNAQPGVIFASEWYMIQSHLAQRLLPRESDFSSSAASAEQLRSIVFAPPKTRNGIAGMKCLVFTSTGFTDGSLRRDICRAVNVMGAIYLPHLATNLTTHLICADHVERNPTEKYLRCAKTPVKAVSLQWVIECLKRWEHVRDESTQEEDVPTFNVPSGSTPAKGGVLEQSQKTGEDMDFYATQISQCETANGNPQSTFLVRSEQPLSLCMATDGHNLSEKQTLSCERRCFLLGSFKGVYSDQAERVENIIRTLGGTTVGKRGETCFEAACTHVVVPPEPQKRTEKMLCAIAAGAIILSSKYFDACQKAATFLPEADHLYDDASLPRLVWQRWQGSKRPFAGMIAVVRHGTVPPPDVICRVIQAGGGRAAEVGSKEATETAGLGPTVCFSPEIPEQEVVSDDSLRTLRDSGIPIVLPNWVLDYLTKTEDVLFDEYQAVEVPDRGAVANKRLRT